ncbi:carboxypeptidase S [Marasmius fiardii PR-910]|nr:carboxypeptidase S [Marasmius fiardii PR-910]
MVLEKSSPLQSPKFLYTVQKPSGRSRKLWCTSLFLTVVWICATWKAGFIPAFNYRSGHQVQVAGDPLCPQTNPLIPDKNLFFWILLDDALKTELFKQRAVNWLGEAVQVETETSDDMGPVGEDPRWETRVRFHQYLEDAFPRVHSIVERIKVNTYGLVYVWKGYDVALKPYILAGHQDVVPVNPDTVDEWAYPPYSGHFDGERIWGRGSSDDKGGLIGILAAVEFLLEQGFIPARTVVLAFGFDEEAGGKSSAGSLAKYLSERFGQNSFAFMIDEGAGYMEQYGSVFATPGIAEKGSTNVNIEVATPGGHSSVPPQHTSIGILSALLVHMEENPFEIHLERGTPLYEFVQCFPHATDLPDSLRKAIKRAKRSDKALKEIEEYIFQNPTLRSLAGTTQAIDIVRGGVKSNALPEQAYAVVNQRVSTTSSVNATWAHDRDLFAELARRFNLTYEAFGEEVSEKDAPSQGHLTLSALTVTEPSPVAPTKGRNAAPFEVLSGSIKATYNAHRSFTNDDVIVAPGMMNGNTDTRFYWDLTEHIFRYNHHNARDPSNAHTVNESIHINTFLEMIRFFGAIILNSDETKTF